jgi:hypothetical protein
MPVANAAGERSQPRPGRRLTAVRYAAVKLRLAEAKLAL